MKMQYWGILLLIRNQPSHKLYDIPQKLNNSHNYNYIDSNQDLDFNNKSCYNQRNFENERMPSEIKQLEKLKNKIKDIECKIQTISKSDYTKDFKYIK
jgi:hypothetical protein